jgi:hypothetical protein
MKKTVPLNTNVLAKLRPAGESRVDDFSDIQPRPANPNAPSADTVAEIADSAGFTIDNFPPIARTFGVRKAKRSSVKVSKTIRMDLFDWNKFVDFCVRRGITAGEGFAFMINKLPATGKADARPANSSPGTAS